MRMIQKKHSLAFALCLVGVSTHTSAAGLLFTVTTSGSTLTINTTAPNHHYPAAGIRINTAGSMLSKIGSQCTKASNGFCLFPVSDSTPATIDIGGRSGMVSITLCLNGKGPLSCQDYSLTVISNDCGRFTTGFTGSWSTVANNPLGSGMGFSGYLPQGAPATFYLGVSNAFNSYSSGSDSYSTLATPPTSFQSYGSMAYFNNFLWAITNGNVIQYNPTTNTWSTPATGLVTKSDTQTTVDDEGNLWAWQDGSTLLEYNIASGTTTTHDLLSSLGSSEPRIVYDSCSRLLYLADYSSPGFYSYDPSSGTLTTLPSLPGSVDFQDGFCSDRSGHIFAVTNGSNMYQYTIATGVWEELPAGGVIGNSNSSCGVGSDGYLYASDPARNSTVYRILLQ